MSVPLARFFCQSINKQQFKSSNTDQKIFGFIKNHPSIHPFCVCGCTSITALMESRGNVLGIASFLPPNGFRRLNLDHKAQCSCLYLESSEPQKTSLHIKI